MIKVREVIERVQSLYSKGLKSSDSRLSSRHIYSVLLGVRATLIKNQINKKQFLSDWSYSVNNCVEMIKVSSIECSCFTHLGCPIYRSKNKLPEILTNLDLHLVDWVMKVDNSQIIEPTFRAENLYNKGNKYTSKKLKYVIENGYLYINSVSSPGVIRLKYIASDPIQAQTFEDKCESKEDCLPAQERLFMIDRDLLTPLIQLSSQELIEIFSQMREDKTNNSSDSLMQESK